MQIYTPIPGKNIKKKNYLILFPIVVFVFCSGPPKKKQRRSDIARKMAEARKEFYYKFGSKTPDRNKLTMMDLIFYNPTSNPMPYVSAK